MPSPDEQFVLDAIAAYEEHEAVVATERAEKTRILREEQENRAAAEQAHQRTIEQRYGPVLTATLANILDADPHGPVLGRLVWSLDRDHHRRLGGRVPDRLVKLKTTLAGIAISAQYSLDTTSINFNGAGIEVVDRASFGELANKIARWKNQDAQEQARKRELGVEASKWREIDLIQVTVGDRDADEIHLKGETYRPVDDGERWTLTYAGETTSTSTRISSADDLARKLSSAISTGMPLRSRHANGWKIWPPNQLPTIEVRTQTRQIRTDSSAATGSI
ncbi:hypothetical protein CGZ91_11770 [Parenemella sanctibonifatiensis]|uniref:Uncharacterized protein n=1 Tax=Parenemella sanctibonifatiensis TaxID=2016505 RepID=A0A255EF35_9ACTN|nr:hypothetical protein CGZ91_11770 [Parenemella sanctibonifatiensis]